MKRLLCITAVAAGLIVVAALVQTAAAGDGLHRGHRKACCPPWHGQYYEPAWGIPVALVVPPTAKKQTDYGWGVGNTRVTKIGPQFQAGWPGPGIYDRSAFWPAPPQPSDTKQMGVYYVRGPW